MNQYEYEIQGNYDGSWECVNTEITRIDALRSVKEHRENEPMYQFRIKKRKVKRFYLK